MKKIALFGASGQTGRLFLEQALENRYLVHAMVRNPQKVILRHPALEVIKGDVLDSERVDTTVRGSDLVVSLFGHVSGSPDWLQTDGSRNIVSAMKKSGVEHIISLSGGGLPFPERDQPRFTDKLIRTVMKLAVPRVLNDAIRHHEVLAESGLKWVIVRAPRLTNGPRKGTYRVGWVGVNASTKISRADLADFILSQVEDETFIHQMPFVSQ